jgi:undecaprenyl diphosphate synthase
MANGFPHINPDKLPVHVAIIMDGNGRWAKKRNRERIYGHIHGIDTVREIVEAAAQTGISYLTLYTFSTENWNRPKEEVEALMNLLAETALREKENLIKNKIKLQILGDKSRLPAHVIRSFDTVERETGKDAELVLNLAVNYGAKNEIISAVNRILTEKKHTEINEEIFERFLFSGNLPDVDLLIRTGGEKRISNFMLWKIAYAELYFTDILWPDFNKTHFYNAIADYQKRERRYGKTSEQIKHE